MTSTRHTENRHVRRGPIEIEVGDVFARVRSATERMLAPLLRCTETEYRPGGPSGCTLVSREASYFSPAGDGGMLIPSGTIPRIVAELRRQGYDVRLIDQRRFDTAEFVRNEALLGAVNPAELRMLQAAAENPMGRFCVPPGGLRDRAIGLLCRYFHHAKIIIPSATLAQTDRLAGALCKQLGGNVDVVHNREWQSPARVVCCTLSSFETAEPYDWNIIVFAAGEQLLASKAVSGWQDFHDPYYFPRPHRIYSFSTPSERHSQATELRLEVLTGPVIYQTATSLGHQADIRVIFAAGPWLPNVRRGTTLEDMQRLVWHNGYRNDLLAVLARACRRADLEALWPCGVLLADQQFPAGRHGGARAAIIVESPEHGRELQQRLPDWPLLHAETGAAGQLAAPSTAQCAWGLPDQAIVTLVRAAQLPQFDTDVLIMATGRSTPSIPAGFLPMVTGAQQRQVLIVDIGDDFDRVARHDALLRAAHYRMRGFNVDISSHGRNRQQGRPE